MLDNLLVTIFIWHFHTKFSSNNIPRKYFTCSIGFHLLRVVTVQFFSDRCEKSCI